MIGLLMIEVKRGATKGRCRQRKDGLLCSELCGERARYEVSWRHRHRGHLKCATRYRCRQHAAQFLQRHHMPARLLDRADEVK